MGHLTSSAYSTDVQIGIDTFVEARTGVSDEQRMRDLLEEIEWADQVGLDVVGVGEHHRSEFLASAPAVVLAAAAVRTRSIRLTSAVTVLSSDDPVRVFQQFATLDLLSGGRAEMIVGRGSFIESYPLFGFDLNDYDALFREKLELLLRVREAVRVEWSGKHRPALSGQGVYPRPVQPTLPIRIGVGGTPQSFVRAGVLGLPLVVAIIGGEPRRFRPLVAMYREQGIENGFVAKQLEVGVHTIGFVADTAQQAADLFYPSYAQMFNKIGEERGWPPVTRAQFEAGCGPHGALMVGDPDTVARKILHVHEVLGGIARLTMLLNGSLLSHSVARRSIELLGTRVAPQVKKALST